MAVTGVTLDSGTGGSSVGVDVVGGLSIPVSKILLGESLADGGLVSSTNQLPVTTTSTLNVATSSTISVVTTSTLNVATSSTISVVTGGSTWQVASNSTLNVATSSTINVITGTSTNIGTIAGAVSGTEMQCDIVTSALPSGAATAANQSTANTALSAIQTAVEILDNAISGNEIQADVLTQPARDNATDTITASLDGAAIMNDTTALTPQFAAISVSGATHNTIVSSTAGKKIRVLRYGIVCSTGVNAVKWTSGTGTDLTGAMEFSANGGISEPFCPIGITETTTGAALMLHLGTATQVSGSLTYVTV